MPLYNFVRYNVACIHTYNHHYLRIYMYLHFDNNPVNKINYIKYEKISNKKDLIEKNDTGLQGSIIPQLYPQ